MRGKLLSLTGLLIIIVLLSQSVQAYSGDYVIIEPNNPTAQDDLVCKGFDNDYYYFVWLKNGVLVKSNNVAATSLTLESSYTNEEDTLKCIVYLDQEHKYELGEKSITLEATDISKPVSITPSEAYTNDDLTCDVTADDDYYYYVWQINGVTKFIESSAKQQSQLFKAYTQKHDVVKCLAYIDSEHSLEVGSASIEILNSKPVAIATISKTNANVGEEITFNASESYDPDGDSLGYLWDFGDGTTSDQKVATHVYNNVGEYAVKLTVSDGEDNSSVVKEININVTNNKPVITFEGGSIKTIEEDETLTFHVEFSDPDLDNLEITVLDKPEDASFILLEQSAGYKRYLFNWTPDYDDSGVYNLHLKVDDGKESTETMIFIQVLNKNRAPVAVMNISKTNAYVNEAITFDASQSHDPDNDELTYLWDFGDGTTSNDKIMTHNYDTAGTYTVTLTVSDGELSDSKSETITINSFPNHKPLIGVNFGNYKTVRENEKLEFGISILDPDGDDINVSFSGVPENAQITLMNQSQGCKKYLFNWTPDYDDSGIYTIKINATDGKETAEETVTIEVIDQNRPPKAIINVSKTNAKVGEEITFNASQSYDPDNDELTYLWDFGDGTTSNEKVTTHAYNVPGTYLVQLTVSDGEYTDSTSISITITGELKISEITCFDKVTANKKQVCSVKVVDNINNPVGDAEVRILNSSTGLELANCKTDSISGACSAEFTVSEPGNYEIYATAEKEGYENGVSQSVSFEVLYQRYELQEFEIYSDPNYNINQDRFYRGETIYVKFRVYDLEQNTYTTQDIIANATLLSYEGGGNLLMKADSDADSNQPGYYHFKAEIPLSHFFIGESAVFGFAINFNDNTMGQADKKIEILNNPPEIIGTISTIKINNSNEKVVINLSKYAYDKEDEHVLTWEAHSYYSSILSVRIIQGTILEIEPLISAKVTTPLTLRVYDLDNDYASTTVNVILNIEPTMPECFPGEVRTCGPETDEGICEYGTQTCINGQWGECIGAVYPQPEIENGLDDNCNGFVDEGFNKKSREEIGIGRITYQTEVSAGQNLEFKVNLDNKKAEDVQFSVLVLLPDLGIAKRVLINADAGESVSRFISLPIPKNTKPGEYLLRISVNNGEFNRVKHRIITVK